jgi:hypothetical protein
VDERIGIDAHKAEQKKDNVWGSRYASKEKGEQGAEDGVRARPLPPTPSCAFGDCVVQLLQRMPLVRRLGVCSLPERTPALEPVVLSVGAGVEVHPHLRLQQLRLLREQQCVAMNNCLENQRQLLGEDVVPEAGGEAMQEVGAADEAVHVQGHALLLLLLLPLGEDVVRPEAAVGGDGVGDGEGEVSGEVAVGEGVSSGEPGAAVPVAVGELYRQLAGIEAGGRAKQLGSLAS